MSACPVPTREWLRQRYGDLVRRALIEAKGFTARKQQVTLAGDHLASVKVVALAGGRARLSFRFMPPDTTVVVKHSVELSAWRP